MVLFTTFWAQNTYEFDKDNFVNFHFNWSILQSCILTATYTMTSLILHPWGFTVNNLSDIVVVKGALICKIIAYLLIAISPMISEYICYISAVFLAIGGVSDPVLKSLLASHGNTGGRFGALHTLKNVAGLCTTIFMIFYSKDMQRTAKNSILPGLHFLISSSFILVGTCIFWMYPAGSDDEDGDFTLTKNSNCNAEKGKIIEITSNSIPLSVQIVEEIFDDEKNIVQNK